MRAGTPRREVSGEEWDLPLPDPSGFPLPASSGTGFAGMTSGVWAVGRYPNVSCPFPTLWIPAPRFLGDRLRGNDG